MHAIAAMLFDDVAYKNILVNELILDKKGMKMSKSKGNAVDPFALFDKYGADATRWYLVTTSPPWRPTLFDEDGLVEVQRKFFGTLTNTYSFFSLYANLDKFEYSEDPIEYEKRPEIDRWIISKLNTLIKDYEESMEKYDVTKAAREVAAFTIDQLSNWYVRRNRRRFWKSEISENKISAYQTLYECLLTIAKLTSPFAPFISEEIYQNLNSESKKENYESVHLSDFPAPDDIDNSLEEKMDIAQRVVYLSRAMRAKANLKVRQPLKQIMVAVDSDKREAVQNMKEVILEEVNIKELLVLEDDSGIVNKSAKANFKKLGPKYGKLVKSLSKVIAELDKALISKLENEGKLELKVDNNDVTIDLDDVEIISSEIEGWVVETDAGVTVAIDTELSEELVAEGYAREFVNRIQNMRKEAGLDVVDRIKVHLQGDERFVNYINNFNKYIMNETLANNIDSGSNSEGFAQEWKIGEFECKITIVKD
jgi:isoleucyl-tRNA synthetase